MKQLSKIFLKGLFAILPLAVTIFILYWLGYSAERTLGRALRAVLPDALYVPGMGVLAGVLVVFGVGLIVSIWGVPRLLQMGEAFIGRIPLVKTIYGAVRDLLGFFQGSGELEEASRVVLVTIGQTGIRAVGLLTRERFDDLPPEFSEEERVAVYVPFSYQIGGFTIMVRREAVVPLNMNLEDAMRFIVTAGVKAGQKRDASDELTATPTSPPRPSDQLS